VEGIRGCSCLNKFQFSNQDINEKNYQLWVSDYANEVEKNEFFRPIKPEFNLL